MSVTKYYLRLASYSSMFTVAGSLIVSVVLNHDYQSEWLTSGSAVMFDFLFSLVYSALLCLVCLPLLLVQIKAFNQSKILTIISWFLLPSILFFSVFGNEIYRSLKYASPMGESLLHLLTLNLPFMIGLIWTFTKYYSKNFK